MQYKLSTQKMFRGWEGKNETKHEPPTQKKSYRQAQGSITPTSNLV
jgi:hypothetical protein